MGTSVYIDQSGALLFCNIASAHWIEVNCLRSTVQSNERGKPSKKVGDTTNVYIGTEVGG